MTLDPVRVDILLVEDNEMDQELTKRALKTDLLSLHLDIVGDGEEAMDYLLKQGTFENKGKGSAHLDLILLDINLPKISGEETLKKIKNEPILRDIPVAMLTGSESEEDLIKSYKYGCNTYITKPITLDKIFHVADDLSSKWGQLEKSYRAQKRKVS